MLGFALFLFSCLAMSPCRNGAASFNITPINVLDAKFIYLIRCTTPVVLVLLPVNEWIPVHKRTSD